MPREEGPTVVAIIGRSPTGWIGPSRYHRFSDFQKSVGQLEAAPPQDFLAGHAACHALMNGVPRIIFSGMATPSPEAFAESLARLRSMTPFNTLLVPGVWDRAQSESFISAFLDERLRYPDAWEETLLWLDAPRSCVASGLIQYSKDIGADPGCVRVVGPHVPTISPGCRSLTALPGSCLIAPLALQTTQTLRGFHDFFSAPIDPGLRSALGEIGAWLTVTGRRSLVCLGTPPPPGAIEKPTPPALSLEEKIQQDLDETLAPTLAQGLPQGPKLWKLLERGAHKMLSEYQRLGKIKGFVIRCDAERNEGSSQPLLAVWIEHHKRVKSIQINLSRH